MTTEKRVCYNGEVKGKKINKICKSCSKAFGDYVSNKRSDFCSLPCYWQARKIDSRYKGYWIGKKRSFEDRTKMSENRKGLTAKEKHPKWKGRISSVFSLIRNSFEYKEWRKEVFKRDKWTCVFCGYRSKGKRKGTRFSDIEADHIESFSKYPNLRFSITNGRTLCFECHKKVTFKKL